MDVSNKIITFDSIENLKSAILADSRSKDVLTQRYCVRFIMLNSFEAFRDLTSFLTTEIDSEVIDLAEKTFGPDKSLPYDALIRIVKDIKQTALITPFSELVRFYPEPHFNGFFNEVILTEDIQNPQKRIYIPIIGLQNRFNDFLKNFGRISESAPIWQFNAPQDDRVMVYVSKFTNFKIPEHLQIWSLPTMRDWLKFWKRQAPKDKILCGARPIRSSWNNSRPDSIFTFRAVENAYEFLTEFLEISVPIDYKADEKSYWETILTQIGSNVASSFSFRKFVEDYFNRKNLGASEILNLWPKQKLDPFGRWILKHYALSQGVFKDSPYFSLVLTETEDLFNPEVLFINFAERILYFTTPAEIEKYHAERRQLMTEYKSTFQTLVPYERQKWLEDRIREFAQKDSNLATVKKLCTSTFTFEKKFFMGWFIHRDDFTISHVKAYYPELFGYLADDAVCKKNSEYSWAKEYFEHYRDAKIKDKFTIELEQVISQKNKDANSFYEWFYLFQESHDLLNNLMAYKTTAPDKVYWIDGLGAEFIPYISYLIEQSKSDYEIIHAEIARTTLPSNTTLNGFKVDGVNSIKLSDLDELAHSDIYRPLESLIEELEVIKKMIDRIISSNKFGNHTIAIVSDHGLSAMSRKKESLKLKGNIKHEGRYIHVEDDEKPHHDDNFVVEHNSIDNKKYMVALTHASLGTKPTHEVHGGCTPEEVLVPFVIISNNDAYKLLPYTIKPLEVSIPISSKILEFSIMPEPKSATITIGNKTYQLVRKNMKWVAEIENATEGKHTVWVTPNIGKSQSFEVEFYGLGFNASFMDDDDF